MGTMSTSVWPKDYLKEQHEIHREHGNHLVVFLISPFKPIERYDKLWEFCQSVCVETGKLIGAEVECIRADSPPTPNVIHQDIWNYIQRSDAIIADVSDRNGNVMLELGVATSWRDKHNVIIIQDKDASECDFLFDISPARHLTYQYSLSGDFAFRDRLRRTLLFALAPAPYVPTNMPTIRLPLNLRLTDPTDCACLISPGNSHRRLLSDGLEFGSFYVFRYSWLTLGVEEYDSIKVQAEMCFTRLRHDDANDRGWIGIMLRSQHFFANYGHLIYVLSDGTVKRTEPKDEFNKEDNDPSLGQIQGFSTIDWVSFDLQFDEHAMSGLVGGVQFSIPVADMPYRYNAGLVRFQTYKARVCVRNLKVELPS